ncbi:FadR/GntR family transcriptional regulator [Maritalea sp.]|uniref:FadR/GntR family transcriptional regulator n=1 Tax=Maritalea sp. TaxID=2003361 RepID=UPI003EF55FA0
MPNEMTATPPRPAVSASQYLRPIKRRTRDVEVLEALAVMIEQAGLKVGDKLPIETELAAKLKVGRSTVREALKVWENLGIVERRTSVGTILAMNIVPNSVHVPVVLQFEAEGLLRTQQVRRALEKEVVQLAAKNATEQDRTKIRDTLATLFEFVEKGIPWHQADANFHRAIYAASGNPLFEQLIEQVHSAFHQHYIEPFMDNSYGLPSIPLHKDLADAVVSGNSAAAVEAVERILDSTEQQTKLLLG